MLINHSLILFYSTSVRLNWIVDIEQTPSAGTPLYAYSDIYNLSTIISSDKWILVGCRNSFHQEFVFVFCSCEWRNARKLRMLCQTKRCAIFSWYKAHATFIEQSKKKYSSVRCECWIKKNGNNRNSRQSPEYFFLHILYTHTSDHTHHLPLFLNAWIFFSSYLISNIYNNIMYNAQ